MTNLYSTLFKWARRQDENFLTDAFVFILNRLLTSEPDTGRRFLEWLCFGSQAAFWDRDEYPKVRTQGTDPEGRPDVWVETLNSLALIEVKKESDLGYDQLKRYRKILDDSKKPHKHLVLLSRYAIELPKGAEKPEREVRWSEVAERMKKLQAVVACPVMTFLLHQFLTFLQTQHMTNERVEKEIVAGTHSQRNLLRLLERTLESAHIEHQRTGGWDWIGFYLDDGQYWVGIAYTWPEEIAFTLEKPAKTDLDQLKTLGWSKHNREWYLALDLCNPPEVFFSLSLDQQLAKLYEFVKLAYKQAKEATLSPPALETPPPAVS